MHSSKTAIQTVISELHAVRPRVRLARHRTADLQRTCTTKVATSTVIITVILRHVMQLHTPEYNDICCAVCMFVQASRVVGECVPQWPRKFWMRPKSMAILTSKKFRQSFVLHFWCDCPYHFGPEKKSARAPPCFPENCARSVSILAQKKFARVPPFVRGFEAHP